ncbi:MAG: hypothetical protein ACLP1D_07870 [Xanthobacteraceae bacterium]
MTARDGVDADDNDFSLAIDRSVSTPDVWHWGIYRLGRKSPIERSARAFKTIATATRAGNIAFRRLMADVHA